jgi:chromosome segregation ATPase
MFKDLQNKFTDHFRVYFEEVDEAFTEYRESMLEKLETEKNILKLDIDKMQKVRIALTNEEQEVVAKIIERKYELTSTNNAIESSSRKLADISMKLGSIEDHLQDIASQKKQLESREEAIKGRESGLERRERVMLDREANLRDLYGRIS